MPRFVLDVAANALKVIMRAFMLTFMIGIPYFIISTAWGWMTNHRRSFSSASAVRVLLPMRTRLGAW